MLKVSIGEVEYTMVVHFDGAVIGDILSDSTAGEPVSKDYNGI